MGAILETSLVFLSGQMLDSAVSDASRQIRTGQAVNATFNVADFRNLICSEPLWPFRLQPGSISGSAPSATFPRLWLHRRSIPPAPPTAHGRHPTPMCPAQARARSWCRSITNGRLYSILAAV
ncbi:hypothetical protein [Devosia algicola]|uniref:hypothetical protein n=1 Tax=Devosia algicola TaxID=3026418 RepID=UPI0038992203